MESRLEEVNNELDREFSEENLSDTSDESNQEDSEAQLLPEDLSKPPEQPVLNRQPTISQEGKVIPKERYLTSNQIALEQIKLLYSPEIQDIINESETSILKLFDFIAADVIASPVSSFSVTQFQPLVIQTSARSCSKEPTCSTRSRTTTR